MGQSHTAQVHYGTYAEYHFEKLQWLQLTEPSLPDQSVAVLLLHGLPRNAQHMVENQWSKPPKVLLQCLQDISSNEAGEDLPLQLPHQQYIFTSNQATRGRQRPSRPNHRTAAIMDGHVGNET